MHSSTFFKSVGTLHTSLLEVRLQFVTLVTLKHVDKLFSVIHIWHSALVIIQEMDPQSDTFTVSPNILLTLALRTYTY
jgi:hypothetical protein